MKPESFQYTTKSRPTTYNGINFRSELEAAWAAFFDLRNITYEYEPLLDLATWRPDFSILVPDYATILDDNGPDPSTVLAEVKPYISWAQWRDDTNTLSKIKYSMGSCFQVLLLGVSPLITDANSIWGISGDENLADNTQFLVFSKDNLKEDWNRAKNMVRWRPQ